MTTECRGCKANTPTVGSRICPECGHTFRGHGWDGIDAHWRARYEDIQSYEQFFASLCEQHRGKRPLVATSSVDLTNEAAELTLMLGAKTVKSISRHRPGEIGIEFTDGSRLFVDRAEDGLELSVTAAES